MSRACKSRNCTQAFLTERGLNTHRASCEHYKRHEAAALQRRKELSRQVRARREKALDRARHQLENKVSILQLAIRYAH